MLRILIVDDEPPARERLRSLLAEIGDTELVGNERQSSKTRHLFAEVVRIR